MRKTRQVGTRVADLRTAITGGRHRVGMLGSDDVETALSAEHEALLNVTPAGLRRILVRRGRNASIPTSSQPR